MLTRNLYYIDGELLMKSDTSESEFFFNVYYSSTSNIGKREQVFNIEREELITGFKEPFILNDLDSYKDFLE